jgi:hypothetical protein
MPVASVNLSTTSFDELEKLAQDEGKTIPELIVDAIALEKWLAETRKKGERVLVERNGTVQEVRVAT